MNICKIIKTVSGDTIIAEIVAETLSYIEVTNPFQIYNEYSSTENQVLNLQVAKWDYSSTFKDPFRIYKTGIISVSTPTSKLEQSYYQVLNTEFLDTEDTEVASEKKDLMSDDELNNFLDELEKKYKKEIH